MMPIDTLLKIFAIWYFLQGSAYALLIYKSPISTGWTWVSVVVGDLMVDLAIALVMVIVLEQSGLWAEFYWFIFIAPVCHILIGGPMIVSQVIKHMDQIKQARMVDNDE